MFRFIGAFRSSIGLNDFGFIMAESAALKFFNKKFSRPATLCIVAENEGFET
jgi:hypothetical protein